MFNASNDSSYSESDNDDFSFRLKLSYPLSINALFKLFFQTVFFYFTFYIYYIENNEPAVSGVTGLIQHKRRKLLFNGFK